MSGSWGLPSQAVLGALRGTGSTAGMSPVAALYLGGGGGERREEKEKKTKIKGEG